MATQRREARAQQEGHHASQGAHHALQEERHASQGTRRAPQRTHRASRAKHLVSAAFALVLGVVLVMGTGCAAAGGPTDEGQTATSDPNAGTAGATIAAPSTTGKLRVEGAQLVSEQGQPVQLRGVSTHGLAWFPQYVNQQLFDELRQSWGANVVRLALYTAESGGYCTGGDQDSLRQLVLDGVDSATQADLYAIVDWHVLNDQDPNAHLDEAKRFFDVMAAECASNDNVIYEICNEPNGATTWAQVKAYAEQVIPVIRAHDPDAVIVVGTPTWSQDVDLAAADPLDGDNIMYALHFYAATHQQPLRDKLEQAVAGGLPVFVTEFGICDASGNGTIDYESADAWVTLMDRLGISYVCWNLSNKDEASALFKPDCAKESGFTEADLSAEGQWLMGVLHAPGFDGIEGDASTDGEPAGSADGAANEAATAEKLAGSDGSLAWQATATGAWEADSASCRQYALSVRNGGAAVGSWTVTVPLGRPFRLLDSWNGEFSVQGTNLVISNASYNGSIAAQGEAADIGFILAFD